MKRIAAVDLPLRRKVLLIVGIAAALALVLTALAATLYELVTSGPRAEAQAQAQVHSIAATVTAAVEFQDARTATQYLSAFGRAPNVHALAIVQNDGTTFAEHHRAGTAPIDFGDPEVREHLHRRRLIFASSVIHPQDEAPAELWIAVRLQPFSERIGSYLPLLGAVAMSLLALAAMLSVTIRRAISEPVQALASAARDVTAKRDYRRRVSSQSHDEIGQLSHDFNAMLEAVEEREMALRRSEETAHRQLIEIESIYANAQAALCAVDLDLRYLRINNLMAEMAGDPAGTLIGRRIEDATPDIATLLTTTCRQVLDSREPVTNVELQSCVTAEDTPRHWVGNFHPLRKESGDIIGVNVAFHDITDRKRAAQERLKLEAQLRQSQKMEALGTLAGGIAHDFNNLLTAVSGNAQLAMQDLPRDHPAALSVSEIQRATDRAKDLVRRILAFSRPEQNIQQLVNLKPVVEEALRLLRATVPRMIDIKLEADPDLPMVMADASQVHQVLMNLGTNACDAMKDRGGTLTVRLVHAYIDATLPSLSPDLHPGSYVCVSVEDTGAGIPPEFIERVFEPFFTTKPHGEGTGLGLSVVHGIVKGHRGAILVRSQPGSGTAFDLYFPAAEAPVHTSNASSSAGSAATGRGERVLYVDDEEQLVFLVTRMMQRMGYDITGMTRASDAIDALRADPHRFDLVLSDLGMPGMSGLDLANELLKIRPDLPIIITSGFVRAEDARLAAEIGVRDIVMKPNTVGEIGQLIRDRLDALS